MSNTKEYFVSPCPTDSYESRVLDSTVSCIKCQTGYVQDPSDPTKCTVLNCDANFSPQLNKCVECGKTKVSDGGTSECKDLNCPLNHKASNHECVICEKGSYSPGGASTSCTVCSAGKYINNGVCTDCEAGKYSSKDGSLLCSNCKSGTYSSSGASVCTECEAGTYQMAEGQGSCKKCPPGKFTNKIGSTECENCDRGTYSDVESSTSCSSCPIGSYQDTTGQALCKKCPKDTYSDTLGNEFCTPCPSYTFTSSTGSTSINDCKKTIDTTDCLLSYTNNGLNFNASTKSQGNSLYYDLNDTNFNIVKDNSYITSLDSGDVTLTKCILNKRISERSELCQSNSPITTNSDGTVIQTNSHSLLQSFEYVNSKGVCVDKTGNYIPYPELNPVGTIGSKEGVLSHIVKCSNPNDAKTCSYEYPLNDIKYTYNPCTSIGMVYDFDTEMCVDPQTSSKSEFDNVCQTYQVYDPVTGKCLNVIKPVETMPANTKGFVTKGDYKNCRTIDKGDCTLVYRLSSIDDTRTASTTNPCTSNNVFNFNTYTCDVPDKSSGFADYRIGKHIIGT